MLRPYVFTPRTSSMAGGGSRIREGLTLIPQSKIKSQIRTDAEIILEEKHGVLLIPEAAVIYDKDKHTSAEVPDPKADNGRRKIPVKLGISNGVKTELVSGLNEGQKVVLQ